jgi:methylmalonyl-CoA mutase N-terminal domain/subunit
MSRRRWAGAIVAIDTLADFEILFHAIPLDQISTSMAINGTAAILLAFYVAAGEKHGVDRGKLRGTIQNDILKEYVSRGTWIWPPRPSLRLIADTIEFCASDVPRFNAISVAGAHFRDAGANAAQEMAFTLMDGITYCDEGAGRESGLNGRRAGLILSLVAAIIEHMFEVPGRR